MINSRKISLALYIVLHYQLVLIGQLSLCSKYINFERGDNSFGIDRLSSNLDMGVAGNSNVWIFSELLTAGAYLTETSKANAQGPIVESDITWDVLIREGDTELYLKKNDNKYEKQAEYTKGLGYKIYLSKDFHCLEDLSYGNSNKLVSEFEWTPEKGERNIKYRIKENIVFSADAKGTLYLPDGIYEATRISQNINRDINKLRLVSNKWMNVFNDFLSNNSMLSKTMTNYVFIETGTGNWLATVFTNPNKTIAKVYYKSLVGANIVSENSGPNQFYLYPSVSFGDLRLEFIRCVAGTYTMEIFNIIGKRIWSKEYYVSGDLAIREDLSFLPKGTYRYTITDSAQNRLATKRLAIIKP